MTSELPTETTPRARPGRTRVLFVAGTGRSGSTVISNLLGSVPGLTAVGELRYLWERGLGENSLCGCGEPVPQCPFWRSVLASAYGDSEPDTASVVQADHALLRLRTFPELLRHRGHAERLGPLAVDYARHLGTVYHALSAVTEGDVVVDASKLVSYAYLLRNVPDVDLYLLHLVRDPRGAAHSWSRTRARADRGAGDAAMNRESPLRSAVMWEAWNGAAELLWRGRPERYVRVRYEDVIADPAAALAPVLSMLDLPAARVPVTADGLVQLSTTHTVAGNPNRMASGPIALRTDDQWRTTMPTTDRTMVTAVTAPLAARYGYRLRTAAPDGTPGAAPDGTSGNAPGAVVDGGPTGGPTLAPRRFVEDQHGLRRLRSRVVRNARWAREQGIGRVLEEQEIDPLRTVPAAVAKWRYRRTSPVAAGTARPVFVVGVQRSGTNMLCRGLGNAAQVEVHNENDDAAFVRYKLLPLETVAALVTASRHSHVLFKPLCDSHRTDQLLDDLGTATAPLALWEYRDVDGRVRSALAKFGDGNRQVLREFAAGVNTTRWHVRRMSEPTAEFVRSFDYAAMTAESGAALMWWVRNTLFFDLGLDQRPDVRAVSYNHFVAEPEPVMRGICAFLGLDYSDALIAHVSARPPTHRRPLLIDERIRARCELLGTRLDAAASGPVTAPAPAPR